MSFKTDPTQGANCPFRPINIDPGIKPLLNKSGVLTSRTTVLFEFDNTLNSLRFREFKLFFKTSSKSIHPSIFNLTFDGK